MIDMSESLGRVSPVAEALLVASFDDRRSKCLANAKQQRDHFLDLVREANIPTTSSENSFILKIAGGHPGEEINSKGNRRNKETYLHELQDDERFIRGWELKNMRLRYLLESCPNQLLRRSDKPRHPFSCYICAAHRNEKQVGHNFMAPKRRRLVQEYLGTKSSSQTTSGVGLNGDWNIELLFDLLQNNKYISKTLPSYSPANMESDDDDMVLRRLNALILHISDAEIIGPFEAPNIQWLRFITCSRLFQMIKRCSRYLNPALASKNRMDGWLSSQNMTFQKFIIELEMELFRIVRNFFEDHQSPQANVILDIRDDENSSSTASKYGQVMFLEADQDKLPDRHVYHGFVSYSMAHTIKLK
ncbi:hypothetical protein LY78DRAFT_697623 [Colletotrichum sublineola]|nr:hypothetical protein LY78DRAFT_697623 [Colletotrichum sublineola]